MHTRALRLKVEIPAHLRDRTACVIVITVIVIFSAAIAMEHTKHIKWQNENTTAVLDYRSYFEKADRREESYFSPQTNKDFDSEREIDSNTSPVFSYVFSLIPILLMMKYS